MAFKLQQIQINKLRREGLPLRSTLEEGIGHKREFVCFFLFFFLFFFFFFFFFFFMTRERETIALGK
jgi:hypothetical protein